MKKLTNHLCLLYFLAMNMWAGAAPPDTITLNWLEKAPIIHSGVSWGVPWAKSIVKKDQAFTLLNAEGKALPLQTWPLATWPDGSVKWSGFATVADSGDKGPFRLVYGKSKNPVVPVAVGQTKNGFKISTGALTCYLSSKGSFLVDSMVIGKRVVASKGRLVCVLEDRSGLEKEGTVRYENFTGSIKKVSIEQLGPVRAVVKIEGMHQSNQGSREWLPFYVRFYFYAGQQEVRMVHSIVFDGDEKRDFISGLGVVFSVPMQEEIQNRHVRFSGEGNGLWSEPVQPLIGRGRRIVSNSGKGDVFADQVSGKRVPDKAEVDQMSQHLMDSWAVWNDFKLVQPNADGFSIVKRTNPLSSWLPVGSGNGRRSSGLAFVGDVSEGLGMGIRNFWQSYPASLEVRHAGAKEAELTAWLWSPDAPAMDLRHYDTVAHGLEEVYEDVQPGFSTPVGIARTSEIMMFPGSGIPAKIVTADQAITTNNPPLLVCTPQYLHSVKALGIWSLPDRSTPFKQQVEDNLDDAITYYKKSVEQNHWFGFWNYGDVMHSYDDVRHEWRYDLGGMA